MKGMFFKKASLFGGILLLSVFVLIQFSWGCDDDDKWDRDCHDKWHCDHYSRPCHPPNIQIVYLDHLAGSIEFNIWGKNFAKGAPPVVTLGGIYKLDVEDDYSDTHIIATLPLQNLNGKFEYGDYRLVVSTCHDSGCKCKYCKGHYSKCKDKYCKDKYCNDHECKCRCKDRYSLTIASPQGPQGMPNLEIVEAKGEQIVDSNNFKGIVYCSQGFKVVGGWFSQDNLNITLSAPLDDKGAKIDNGWSVEGTMVTNIAPASLYIWAMCGKVQ